MVFGPHAERLAAPPVAGAAEAGDHLVADQHDVVLVEDRLDRREVGLRRHDDAARAHHRLGDHRRDRVGSLALDQVLQRLRQARDEVRLALALGAEAVVMRAIGMQDAVDRQVEAVVVAGKAGQRGGHDGDAVIGLDARDDLLLLAAGRAHCSCTRRA